MSLLALEIGGAGSQVAEVQERDKLGLGRIEGHPLCAVREAPPSSERVATFASGAARTRPGEMRRVIHSLVHGANIRNRIRI